MNNIERHSLAIENSADTKAESAHLKYLFIDAGVGPYINVAELSKTFALKQNEISDRSAESEFFKIPSRLIAAIRSLNRQMGDFDSVHVFYDGSKSAIRNLMPAVVLARFYGKPVTLHYYPGELFEKIGWYHYKLMKLFSRVIVGSRFVKRALEKNGVKSEVHWPFTDVVLLALRNIVQLQPHLLLVHDDADDSGAVCAMRAYKFVKQKYPRTELTVVTNNIKSWKAATERDGQLSAGINFVNPAGPGELKSAFASTDLFINCTLSEPMPLALVAAMSAGMPAISYETYAPREIIENGQNGFLIRHNDSNQLADRIIELVENQDLTARISSQAAKVRDRVSTEKLVRLIAG